LAIVDNQSIYIKKVQKEKTNKSRVGVGRYQTPRARK